MVDSIVSGIALPVVAISGDGAADNPAARPSNPGATVPSVSSAAGQDLQDLAQSLNQHAQELQTSLHFQVDKITGQMVISVIDTQNDQVLMQIPGQEALAIAQSLERLHPQLMDKTA